MCSQGCAESGGHGFVELRFVVDGGARSDGVVELRFVVDGGARSDGVVEPGPKIRNLIRIRIRDINRI